LLKKNVINNINIHRGVIFVKVEVHLCCISLVSRMGSRLNIKLAASVDMAEFSTGKWLLVEIYGDTLVHRLRCNDAALSLSEKSFRYYAIFLKLHMLLPMLSFSFSLRFFNAPIILALQFSIISKYAGSSSNCHFRSCWVSNLVLILYTILFSSVSIPRDLIPLGIRG